MSAAGVSFILAGVSFILPKTKLSPCRKHATDDASA